MSSVQIPFQRHQLDNGLRVVLSPDHTVPVVALNIWYAVGSRNEPPGRTGFAHLFEHMMFQGSAHVPKNRHFELVERAGGSLNATTSYDRTNYFDTLPSHHLDLALWLESDRMGWMADAMTAEKLENQQSVVMEEKKQRYDNQPYGDWIERMQAMVFPEGHPYHHTVIGSMEDIGAATLEDVRDFFGTYYLPNNAVLTLCGDFEPVDALARVDRYFGAIAPGSEPPPVPGTTDIPTVLGSTVQLSVTSQVPLPRVFIAGRIPPYGQTGNVVARVAATILGQGRASRLYRNMVRGERVAKDVGTYAFPLVTGNSMQISWATGFEESDPEVLVDALVRQMEELVSASDREVDRARALAETEWLTSMEEVEDRADALSRFTCLFDDPGMINTELDRFRSVTTADVREFAEAYLSDDNRAVLIYLPEEGEDD
jgi:predicted Zn-dependent peptidase